MSDFDNWTVEFEKIMQDRKPPCPACGSKGPYLFDEHAAALNLAGPGGSVPGPDARLLAWMTCEECGYVSMYDLGPMGLID